MSSADSFQGLQKEWGDAWPLAIADWSPFVQLHEPVWCLTAGEEKRESLTGSFAMIRLVDHSVVISLRQIHDKGLARFAREILAHEIGHHVYCPADLTDNARMLARMRRGLPGCETYAPMVANLYADLLINDRLQRSCGLDMAGVYQALKSGKRETKLWQLYLRTYELLWSLPVQTLTQERVTQRVDQDALLGSRLVRVYHRDWLGGAGRFACLLLPYIVEEAEAARENCGIWCDTLQAGQGGSPDGLTEIDDDEIDGTMHPAEDPVLSGLEPIDPGDEPGGGRGKASGNSSGLKSLKSYRDPFDYAEILKAAGSNLSPREIAIRYYRERAIPYLIPFPARESPVATDPIPEGLDIWDPSDDMDQIDWVGTLQTSPSVIPGITTRQRLVGESPGHQPERTPIDLYLGVDCSGSMRDPSLTLSYPILAGAVIALSALRAGSRVKVVLSGEPGKTVSTDGFVRHRSDVMQTLLNYLGTGYAFGIHRLAETFTEDSRPDRAAHILIVSDYDMFAMLDEQGNRRLGWDVAREAVQRCGGGGTYVLQLPGYKADVRDRYHKAIERMQTDGWNVYLVNSLDELTGFARQFSRTRYHQSAGR